MAPAERGSAVADFVMVAGLVSFLFVGLLQLGFVLHTRNTLIASAAEGARLGARADANCRVGLPSRSPPPRRSAAASVSWWCTWRPPCPSSDPSAWVVTSG